MDFSRFSKISLTSAALLSIASCGEVGPGQIASQASQDVRDDFSQTQAAFEIFRGEEGVRSGGAQISDGVFVAPIKERNNSSPLLPSRVQSSNAVIMTSRDSLSLDQIASRLTEITGIEHISSLGAPSAKMIRPNFSGKLSEVLGELSIRFGVEWTYTDGKIIFRDFVTRQYQIPVIPSIATGGSSVGGSKSDYTADFWSEFEASVQGILDDDVIYNISRTTGLLTVTAMVDDHAEVSSFVNEISKSMSQQIAFDVNVLSVTLNDSSGFGIDLDLAFSDIGSGGRLDLNSDGNLSESTAGMNLSILEGQVSLNAIIQSLSRQGSVSVDTRTGVTTVNNRPVPVEVVDTISYVASIQSETDDETGDVTLIPEPATQDVGFAMQLYPRIMNTNEIMVEYSLSLSELRSLSTFGEGENQIQLPEVSNTNFSQQTVLQNGSTLILSGFERDRTIIEESNSSSVGGLLGIGGSKSATTERVATVVMIRPRILATRRSIGNGRN